MASDSVQGKKASDLFIECLEAEGCEYIFGVPGEENLDFLDSLSRSKQIKLILTRHEQGAGFMADGYARVSGRPAAAFVITGPGLAGFMRVMYGNQPARWDDSLAGHDRWRMVLNALTRIRYCTPDGTLEFDTKDGSGVAPPGHLAWFDVPGRRSAGEPIAFGHWSTLGLRLQPDLLSLDTGCVWGGALTAVRVDGGRRDITQVHCPEGRKLFPQMSVLDRKSVV